MNDQTIQNETPKPETANRSRSTDGSAVLALQFPDEAIAAMRQLRLDWQGELHVSVVFRDVPEPGFLVSVENDDELVAAQQQLPPRVHGFPIYWTWRVPQLLHVDQEDIDLRDCSSDVV